MTNEVITFRESEFVEAPEAEGEQKKQPENTESSDGTLAKYFQEIASHQVLGPDEESLIAQELEARETCGGRFWAIHRRWIW